MLKINKHREEILWRREEIEVVAGEERRSKLLPWRRGDGCVRRSRKKTGEEEIEACIEAVTLEKMLDWAMEEMLDWGSMEEKIDDEELIDGGVKKTGGV
ncbi:hypothetical protein L6452_02999 [Arctium lappa]|uniref:Uncharacterized protein n=1 Tax=Arctium lappa TaxID=4217 RepID=A0ACB9FLU8_ARCLA|nr:hypothetical protein L6452_02999 [Arctium lappa]